MNVSTGQINLLEATNVLRDDFLSLLDKYKRADENWSNAGLARTDFSA